MRMGELTLAWCFASSMVAFVILHKTVLPRLPLPPQPEMAPITDYWGGADPKIGSLLPKEIEASLSSGKEVVLVVFAECSSCTLNPVLPYAEGDKHRIPVINLIPEDQEATFRSRVAPDSQPMIIPVKKSTLETLNPSFQPRVYGYTGDKRLTYLQSAPGELKNVISECRKSMER